MKWVSVMALAGLCAACGTPGALSLADAEDAGPAAGAVATATHEEITLPAGTTLRLELASAVASDSSKVEDTVRAVLRQAVSVDGRVVLPAGTELVGTVTNVERSGRVKGLAKVGYRFTTLHHDGERMAIRTAPLVHEAQPTKGDDAKKIAIGAGAGAAVGAVLGGGSGAAKGAAIGGAGGTGVVLATRGDEVRLGPGAQVNTRLTEALTLVVKL
jgi:hypothetical protein